METTPVTPTDGRRFSLSHGERAGVRGIFAHNFVKAESLAIASRIPSFRLPGLCLWLRLWRAVHPRLMFFNHRFQCSPSPMLRAS
jgi:hypothetical protein